MAKKIDLDELSADEKARLPGRLRALDRDEWHQEWAAAKAERNAAYADAEALAESDPETSADLMAVARDAWLERKAELLKAQPAVEG